MFEISLSAICISKQKCGNVGALVRSVHKGVFFFFFFLISGSHSWSLLGFREIRLTLLVRCKTCSSDFWWCSCLSFCWESTRLDFYHSLWQSLSHKVTDGPPGCVAWSRTSEARPCAAASRFMYASAKIDLLKGQQPLNLIFFPLRGTHRRKQTFSLRYMCVGWTFAFFLILQTNTF